MNNLQNIPLPFGRGMLFWEGVIKMDFNIFQDEMGFSTIEYIVGAGVIAAVALAVFLSLQDSFSGTANHIKDAITIMGGG